MLFFLRVIINRALKKIVRAIALSFLDHLIADLSGLLVSLHILQSPPPLKHDKQKDEWLWEAREGVILYNNIIYIFPTLAL